MKNSFSVFFPKRFCAGYFLFWFSELFLLLTLSFGLKASEIRAIPEDTLRSSAFLFSVQDGDSPKWWSSAPEKWQPFQNAQTCRTAAGKGFGSEKLVFDFEFVGHGGIEYLAFGADIPEITEERFIGIRYDLKESNGQPLQLPFNLRFIDPSGECHQIPLNHSSNGWLIGRIDSSGGCWGGDRDKTLQFPCRFESVTMDRKFDGYAVKGRLEVEDIRFFTKNEIRPMIHVELADEELRGGTNILPVSGGSARKIRFRFSALDEFKELPLFVEIRRVRNPNFSLADDEDLSEETVSSDLGPNDFQKVTVPVAQGEIEIEHGVQSGFESIIFTPILSENGAETIGQPLKFSFSVPYADSSPEIGSPEFRNRWFGVSTHANIGCVDRLSLAGFGMIRDDCVWRHIEKEKGVYSFPKYLDEYVNRTLELGLEPLIIILYSNPLYDGDDFPHTEEGIAAYSRYASEVVRHFQGRCRYFEVWNEWNGACTMNHAAHTGSNTPENYVRLLKAASKAMREANPDIFIIGGGGDHYVYHKKQIQREMELGVMKYCDAYSIHPYIYPKTPESEGYLEKMKEIISLMRENGCETPRVWLTELGWPTYRGLRFDLEKENASVNREEFSARMFVRYALECRSLPEIERFFWYDLQNDGMDAGFNEHNFGILQNHQTGWQPKAVYSAMGTLIRLTADAEVSLCSELSTEKTRVWKIVRKDGETILCAWTLEENETAVFSGGMKIRKVLGLYGNELPPETRLVTPQPIYFWLSR